MTSLPSTPWLAAGPEVCHELDLNGIDIWRASLDLTPDKISIYSSLLSSEEKLRADRYRFPVHQCRFIASHGILRIILSNYLKIAPREIDFSANVYGKPALKNDQCDAGETSALRFNLSHSRDMVLYAVTRDREIGIDVEYTGRNCDIEKIARRFFTPGEVKKIEKLSPDRRRKAFFACWTRKEAFIKAKGFGLSIPLHQFEVSVLPEELPMLLKTAWAPDEHLKWTIFNIDNGNDYAAAVAVKGTKSYIRCFDAGVCAEEMLFASKGV